jgi:heterodisulfide reductase subunit B
LIKKIECVILDSRRLNVAKGYCCLPLKANKYSLSENKENRGFSDSIMWGPVHEVEK